MTTPDLNKAMKLITHIIASTICLTASVWLPFWTPWYCEWATSGHDGWWIIPWAATCVAAVFGCCTWCVWSWATYIDEGLKR